RHRGQPEHRVRHRPRGAGRVRPGRASPAQAPHARPQDERADLRRRPAVAYQRADATPIPLVTDPGRFDVIVTDNLFGDILTDLAAAVTGGIGLAASGNINPDRRFPSMFEPVHGSAPDIAGQGIADPTATILSVALLLNHCGLSEEARRVERAVIADIAARTAGQLRTTSEIGDAIAAAI